MDLLSMEGILPSWLATWHVVLVCWFVVVAVIGIGFLKSKAQRASGSEPTMTGLVSNLIKGNAKDEKDPGSFLRKR